MPIAAVVAFDNCNASSVTAFVDVLDAANHLWTRTERRSRRLFAWEIVSPDGKPVTTSAGLRLGVDGGLPRRRADVIYVPACNFTGEERLLRETAAISKAIGPWLVKQRRDGAWLTAGCSGVFVLGRCGFLDGKRATTSWWLTETFAREFPKVRLREDEIVSCGDRLICAGPLNAHFNLALRVVEAFGGRDLALACSKVLLVDANRPSQRPYIVLQDQLRHTDALVVRAQEWMRRHLLRSDLSVATLARAVGASERNLVRRFRSASGTTPVAYLQDLRIQLAKNLLETTDLGLAAIVERVGYQDEASFRRLFRQKTTLSPREYRRRFAVGRSVVRRPS